jgi:hypothetical protein
LRENDLFPDPAVRGVIAYESNNDFKAKSHEDIVLKVKQMDKKVTVVVPKENGTIRNSNYRSDRLYFFYGSKAYVLPFKIKLNDFIASKYPGTEKVTLRLKVKLLFKILQKFLMPEYL